MLAVGLGPIGPIEGLIILAVILLIFGASRLGDIGGALGKSIREFRKAAREEEPPAQSGPSKCSNCGSEITGAVKFCAQCGTPTGAAVG